MGFDVTTEELAYLKRESRTRRDIIKKEELPTKSIQYFKAWRKSKGIKFCRDCGKRLTNETHHKLCNNCWNIEQMKNQI